MSDQSRSVTFVIWERLRVKTVKKSHSKSCSSWSARGTKRLKTD